jgi:hypothetical protein
LQVCSAVNGCLQWLDTAACGDNEICCSGACQALTSNASCESDYFVDAQSGVDDPDAGPDRGTEAHPFRTITVAIAEAQRSMTASKRIHVAAGRYDATLGERFPLILRNGVSLFGAGADKVTVQGLGTYDHGTEGGTYADVYSLTILVGDDALPTVVSGMTLRGGDTTPTPTHHGILCDRGSGASGGAAAGATILDNIVVGPNYDNGIVAATSTVPTKSGCNLRMTRSTVTSGTWGVVAVGCMVGVTKVPVAVHIGDETGGNTFRWLSSPTDPTGAILIWPCVTNSSVRHNLISDSGYGVTIDQADDAPAGVGVNKFTIDDNVFTRLTISGVFVWSEATSLEELNDNTFTEISASLAGDMTRVAWGLAADGKGALFPPIKQARRNRFVGNDAAIVFGDSTGVSFGTTGPVDFGRVDDPGGNVFHCNSKPSGVAGDLLISVSGTGAIPFAGNVWDHVPLTTGIDGTAVNGTDVIFFKTPQPALDTTNGAVDTSACPAGRVLGP